MNENGFITNADERAIRNEKRNRYMNEPLQLKTLIPIQGKQCFDLQIKFAKLVKSRNSTNAETLSWLMQLAEKSGIIAVYSQWVKNTWMKQK